MKPQLTLYLSVIENSGLIYKTNLTSRGYTCRLYATTSL